MDVSPQDDASFRDYIGLFLLGAGVLLLELALTRVLSVLVWYHFAFLIVAVALLGFGVSGTLLTVWPRLSRAPLGRILPGCGVGFGVSAVLGFLATSRIPFRPFGVLGDGTQILYLGLVFVLLSVPFACAGTAVGAMLSRWPHAAGGIYGADLVGAGLGCLVFPPTISVFGGAGSVIVAALFGCGAVLCFSWRQGAFWRRVFISVLAGIGLGLWGGTRCLSAGSDAAKRIFQIGPERILHTEWNAFSRIDVIAPTSPDDALMVVIDGGAATAYIPRIEAGLEGEEGDRVRDGLPLIHQMKTEADVLVIGSGGGIDVRDFLVNGARSVTAVEINPILNRLVTRTYADFAGHLYADPRVRWVTEDARSFLHWSRQPYDIIFAGLTITNAASASGALSLVENHLLTVEALQEALERLTEDGILYILRPELDVLRLTATAARALRQVGLADPMGSVVVLRLPSGDGLFSRRAALMVKRGPFIDAELLQIQTYTPRYAWEVRYRPGQFGDTPFHRVLSGDTAGNLLPGLPVTVDPATDDRPFFNHFFPWRVLIHPDLSRALEDLYEVEQTPAAEAAVVVVLVLSVGLAAGLLLLPLWLANGPEKLKQSGTAARLIYFLALGLGFLFLEIGFIERFALLLGHPTYALVVALGSLLVFSGMGSLLVLRLDRSGDRAWRALLAGIVACILLEVRLLPWIFEVALKWPLSWRMSVAIGLLGVPGVLLGTAFPLGIRRAGERAPDQVPWLWGANGFASVTGSALGLMVAMTFGLTALLNTAACVYGVALASVVWQTRAGSRERVRG